jgi:HEAT repeat protein
VTPRLVRTLLPWITVLSACDEPRVDTAGVEATATTRFELTRVVRTALADRPASPMPDALDPELENELDGLTTLVSSDRSMLALAAEDVAGMGSGAWTKLAAIARDAKRADGERAAAIDLIAPETRLGVLALCALVTDAAPAWVRARAAWSLASNGPDHLVPFLLLRLKYEVDHEVVVWIAVALARHGNLAGLEGLVAISRDPESTARASAEQQLRLLLERVGYESTEDVLEAWNASASERRVPVEPRSEAYRFAVLEEIGRLDEFQLRGVDDARFVLARMDDLAARELAAALHDESVYIRVHAAQCLQRMGSRARGAGPTLVAALDEPELAPHAAAALGDIGFADAESPLVARLAPESPLALRLACARALGFLSSFPAASAARALRPLLDAEPPELSQAASESLVRRDPGARDAVLRLTAMLEDPALDPGSTERALRAWLVASNRTDALARWDALARPADRIEALEETRRRRDARVALLRALEDS